MMSPFANFVICAVQHANYSVMHQSVAHDVLNISQWYARLNTTDTQGGDIGGVWVYTDETEGDPMACDAQRARVHSSMYRSLRTNLPREVCTTRGSLCTLCCAGSQTWRTR